MQYYEIRIVFSSLLIENEQVLTEKKIPLYLYTQTNVFNS
jgi:hypothetical protein